MLSLLNIESFIADEGDLLQACFILVTEVDIECDIEAFLTAESGDISEVDLGFFKGGRVLILVHG